MAVTATVRNLSNWAPVSQLTASISTDYHFDFASRATGVWPVSPVPANAMMFVRFDFVGANPSLGDYNSTGSRFAQYRFNSSSLELVESFSSGIGVSGFSAVASASGNNMRLTFNTATADIVGYDMTVACTIVMAQIL